jgi:hypothetical protein
MIDNRFEFYIVFDTNMHCRDGATKAKGDNPYRKSNIQEDWTATTRVAELGSSESSTD